MASKRNLGPGGCIEWASFAWIASANHPLEIWLHDKYRNEHSATHALAGNCAEGLAPRDSWPTHYTHPLHPWAECLGSNLHSHPVQCTNANRFWGPCNAMRSSERCGSTWWLWRGLPGMGCWTRGLNRDEILDFPRIIEIPSSGAVQHIRAGGVRLSSYRLWQGTRLRPQQQ